jgi:predicted PurR-regulated permease PerM
VRGKGLDTRVRRREDPVPSRERARAGARRKGVPSWERLVVVHQLPAGQVFRAGLVLLALGLGLYLLWHLQEVVFLLLGAILLATTVEPIVDQLRRGPFTRGTGVLAVYTTLLIVVALPIVLLVPGLLAQLSGFSAALPGRIAALRFYAAALQPPLLRTIALSGLTDLQQQLSGPPDSAGDRIVALGTSALHAALDVVLLFVMSLYWLMERNALKRIALRAVPRHRARQVNQIWVELEAALGAWVRGQLILMLIVGVVAGLGFLLLGLPSPLVLAVGAGLAEVIPIVGPVLAFAPAVLVALATTPAKLPLLIAYAVIVQVIESHLLVPRVMSHTVGINPLIIILGIQIGATLDGLPGALLAVPVAAAIQVLLTHTYAVEGSVLAEAREK